MTLAQKEYKRRHDNVARAIHWDVGLREMNGWYDHVPEIVLSENDDYKHLWDFSIPQDHEIEAKTRVADH